MSEESVQLNHTIVPVRDQEESAAFLADLLGLPDPVPFGHFTTVQLDNGVTLDFIDSGDKIPSLHYAFLISEDKFDQVFARIEALGLSYWADPARTHPGEINRHDGGRGMYFEDPSGHFLEVLTRPYGSGD